MKKLWTWWNRHGGTGLDRRSAVSAVSRLTQEDN